MSLDRFVKAQANTYEAALSELRAGHKRGHWIWWIFPQLRGLGRSERSIFYGIADEAEVMAYLRHPVLGQRYHECVREVFQQLIMNDRTPAELMGSEVDVMKLRSSLELFFPYVLAPKEIQALGALPVMLERILREKLDWTHPSEAGPGCLTEFSAFDPFMASQMMNGGHVLLCGSAGTGKSLLLNNQLLPWMRAHGRHHVVVDFHGEMDPLPRGSVFDPDRQSSDDLMALAADALKSSVILTRRDAGWADGPAWDHLLKCFLAKVRAGGGPIKSWFLVVDVSSHSDQLAALWEFLPDAAAFGCTLIVMIQRTDRLPPEVLRRFSVVAQFNSGYSRDIQAVAPADIPEWPKTVTNLKARHFLLKVGTAFPRGYRLERS